MQIMYGVGKATLRDFVDATKVVALAKLKDLGIDVAGSEDKITGGDSPYAIASMPKDIAIKISATNATFDMKMLNATQGADITTGTVSFEEMMEVIIPDDGIVNLEFDPDANSVIVDGFTKVDTAPTTGKFQQDTVDDKKLTFAVADKGKEVVIIYTRSSNANTMTMSVLKDTMAKPFKFTHRIPIYDDNNTIVAQGQLVVFKAKANNSFNFNLQAQQAFAPKLELEAQDPKRPDKKLWDFSIEPVA